MKIVKLKGGLGNQMFQYAFAQLIKDRTGEEVLLDFSEYCNIDNDSVRVPRITKFRVKIDQASKQELGKVLLLPHPGNPRKYLYRFGIVAEAVLNRKYFFEKNRAYRNPDELLHYQYYDGYWQSWRYVEEVRKKLLDAFEPNYQLNNELLEEMETIRQENSVFVGVRRGDYLAYQKHYGSFSEAYYRKAMAYIDDHVDNPIYYIFSNDIDWVKQNLNFGEHRIIYRDRPDINDFEELLVMSSCRNAIIVNSTFNWWGAWLIRNPSKIVCCPQKWFFDEAPIDIIPEDWVRISEK